MQRCETKFRSTGDFFFEVLVIELMNANQVLTQSCIPSLGLALAIEHTEEDEDSRDRVLIPLLNCPMQIITYNRKSAKICLEGKTERIQSRKAGETTGHNGSDETSPYLIPRIISHVTLLEL